MKSVLISMLLLAMVTGCEPAIISSAIRSSDSMVPYMETRCEPLDMRDSAELKRVLSNYDGWRMVYVSEYTTGNRFGVAGVICLERPQK